MEGRRESDGCDITLHKLLRDVVCLSLANGKCRKARSFSEVECLGRVACPVLSAECLFVRGNIYFVAIFPLKFDPLTVSSLINNGGDL